ncbi:N-acetylmuramoyl-L-alanine amidase family protein [Clostridium sp. MB05]
MLKQMLIDEHKYKEKCPYYMEPKGICIHNTANDASAENERNNINRVDSNSEVSFHIAIDDKEAIQLIPFNRNVWHAGDGSNGDGNRNYIAIEICYSKSGGDRFIKAEQRAAKEVASLLKQYGWGISKIRKHQDFSGKYCPHRTLDMGWQRFLNMAQAELGGSSSANISSIQPESKPQPPEIEQYLFLKPHMNKWNVYATNVKPTIGNECGTLAPSNYGGLEYKILGNSQKDVYTIQTKSFGIVNIYVPKDGDSEFYSKGESNQQQEKPQQSKKQYLNLNPQVNSWRVYPTNVAPIIGNEVGFLAPSRYGGLSYEILGNPQNDVYTIKTETFGIVNIYASNDEDRLITLYSIY